MQSSPFAAQTYAVIGDVHLRWVDKAAYDLTLAVLESVKPSHVILNGDILDCTGLSKYAKDPDEVDRLQEEIHAWERLIKAIKRIVGDVPIDYTLGNHEARLERYLQDNAPALRSLDALSLPHLLKFREYGVTFYRDEIVLAERRLVVHHGSMVRKDSGQSARAELTKLRHQVSTLTGHTHRMGWVPATLPFSEQVVAGWEGGTLHRLDAEYVRHPDWQQGMSVVSVAGCNFAVEQLLYLGNAKRRWTVYRGEMIRT
jgi:predicted phosphodiesterase